MERQISLRLPQDLLDLLDERAEESGVPRSALVRRAIRAYLDSGMLGSEERPVDRVRDLIGVAYGGPSDLGHRHREYLKDLLVDRR